MQQAHLQVVVNGMAHQGATRGQRQHFALHLAEAGSPEQVVWPDAADKSAVVDHPLLRLHPRVQQDMAMIVHNAHPSHHIVQRSGHASCVFARTARLHLQFYSWLSVRQSKGKP